MLQARIDEATPTHGAVSSLEGAAVEKLATANSTLVEGFERDLDKVEGRQQKNSARRGSRALPGPRTLRFARVPRSWPPIPRGHCLGPRKP